MTNPPASLESHLRNRRDQGRKLLIPYITGGYPVGDWTKLIDGLASAGADAIEIGLPFSDPVMDGPTIQESSKLALDSGATPNSILTELQHTTSPGIPLVAMTYYNICYRMGHRRFGAALREAGISAAILPDLPVEELEPWARAAEQEEIETVLLAAPTGSDERLRLVAERSQGFVYGVGLVGTTGERAALAASALDIASRLKAMTDKVVAIGIGVSSPEQAAEVCQIADGVVVGSAVIRKILEGGIGEAVSFVAAMREALDQL